jgi:hypothetical protein
MFKSARSLAVGAVVAFAAGTFAVVSASAQDGYWTNHWRWYDNTYSPYYHRYYNKYYGSPGYYNPSYPAYTGPGYYNNYYYGPSYVVPYHGVQAGPLRFGWW